MPNEAIVRHMHKADYDGWYTLENLVGDDILADAPAGRRRPLLREREPRADRRISCVFLEGLDI